MENEDMILDERVNLARAIAFTSNSSENSALLDLLNNSPNRFQYNELTKKSDNDYRMQLIDTATAGGYELRLPKSLYESKQAVLHVKRADERYSLSAQEIQEKSVSQDGKQIKPKEKRKLKLADKIKIGVATGLLTMNLGSCVYGLARAGEAKSYLEITRPAEMKEDFKKMEELRKEIVVSENISSRYDAVKNRFVNLRKQLEEMVENNPKKYELREKEAANLSDVGMWRFALGGFGTIFCWVYIMAKNDTNAEARKNEAN